MNSSITAKLKEQKQFLKDHYRINKIGVFGSYARNEETPESDIDILVEFEKVPDLFTFIDVEIYLEKILKKKVDMVRQQGLKEKIKQRILSEVVYL